MNRSLPGCREARKSILSRGNSLDRRTEWREGLGEEPEALRDWLKKKKIQDRKTHRETRGIEMASRHREKEQLATGETDTYRHTDTKKSAWWCAGRVGG